MICDFDHENFSGQNVIYANFCALFSFVAFSMRAVMIDLRARDPSTYKIIRVINMRAVL